MKSRVLLSFVVLALLPAFPLAFQAEAPPEQFIEGHYIVLLRDASVVERVIEWTPGESLEARRQALHGEAAVRYREVLERRQLEVIETLRGSGMSPQTAPAAQRLEVLARRSFLANMLVVKAQEGEVVRLGGHEEVRAVYPVEKRYPLMDAAPEVVGAQALWAAPQLQGEPGLGIRIGIIDSGLARHFLDPITQEDRFEFHPMFDDTGFSMPSGFPQGNTPFTSGATNSKVIVARNYVSPQFGLRTQTNNTPADERGHGSQVAGVAAGRRVSAPLGELQGIAPFAHLGSYKVFGTPGINDTTTSAAIIAALNDAVQDGMDVVNLSLGGTPRDPATDPEQLVIANATAAGVVVVIAAGNRGPGAGTLTSPGTSPHAISVGASSNGRFFGSALDVEPETGELPPDLETIGYVPSQVTQIHALLGPWPLVSVGDLDPGELACGSQPFAAEAFSGRAVLVRRGICTFQEKANNVFVAGAVALIVYNNAEGPPLIMGMSSAGGPAVMIDNPRGEGLRDFLLAGNAARVRIRASGDLVGLPAQSDIIASFSSRGPGIDGSIKPDLVAPGVDIYTAAREEHNFSRGITGTSFSSPLVAGAAALLRQLRADWAPQMTAQAWAAAIKSLIVNTAAKTPTWEGAPAGVVQTGNGRLELLSALQATAVLDPVSASFGVHLEDRTRVETRALTLTNRADQTETFDVEVVERRLTPRVRLTANPSSLTLASGESGMIQLSARLDAPLRPGVFEGFVQISSRQGPTQLTASYWGGIAVPGVGDQLLVAETGGAPFTDLDSALAAAAPGDVVEIADSGTYLGPFNLALNELGLPLHHLTVRAREGERPLLDGRAGTNQAALTVSGLTGVTIQGLEIEGGNSGISFRDSSGAAIGNLIRDAGSGSSAQGISLLRSQVHLYENVVEERTGPAISAAFSSALIQKNRLSSNPGGALSASSGALALFDSELSGNGGGSGSQAVILTDVAGLLKGNRIRETKGPPGGDGILARGSGTRLRLQDNIVEENSRGGILIAENARASVVRSLLRNNAQSALSVTANAEAVVQSTRLLQNGRGIFLNVGRAEISDTLVAGSTGPEPDGITSQLGNLRVLNSTLAGNSRFGIQIQLEGGTTLVANSILFQNGQAEVSGGSAASFRNNLFGSLPFPSAQDNLIGDPLFADGPALDFSLRPGSPAIDRASDAFPPSQHDLLFRERRAPGTPGEPARVDLGALEFGSRHAPPLILPVLSTSELEFVGLALADVFHPPEGDPDFTPGGSVRLTAYTLDGRQRGVFEIDVPALTQFATLLREVFPDLEEGWIEIRSTGPDLMSFTQVGDFASRRLDGAQLSSSAVPELVFPEVRSEAGEQTHFFVINPNDRQADVLLRWSRPNSGPVEEIRTIAARGMLRFEFAEVFGPGSGGFVIARALDDMPLAGMQIFETPEVRGGLLALDAGAAGPTLVAAHLASAPPQVKTELNVINLGPDTEVTLNVIDEQGNLVKSVSFPNVPQGGQLRGDVRQLLNLDETALFGWVGIQSTSGQLAGSLTFGDLEGRFLASLPLQSQGSREFILSHVAQTPDLFTGVALLNPDGQQALVSIEVFTGAGMRTGLALLQLGPRHKIARLLNELLPELPNQAGGFVRIRSTIPLFGFELFGNFGLDFLSAVPPQVVVH